MAGIDLATINSIRQAVNAPCGAADAFHSIENAIYDRRTSSPSLSAGIIGVRNEPSARSSSYITTHFCTCTCVYDNGHAVAWNILERRAGGRDNTCVFIDESIAQHIS